MPDVAKLEKVLMYWNQSQSSPVTWEMILQALVNLERKRTARKVLEYLEEPETYSKYIAKMDFPDFGTDTSHTTSIKDEELQKMEQAFQTSVQEHGALKVNLAHYMPFGPPGVGKTCLLRRLVDKDPLGDPATITNPCGNSQSTDAFEERHPIQVTVETRSDYEPKAVVTDNTKWAEVENVKEEIAILVKTLANRPDDSDSPPIITNESANSQEVHPISLEVNTNPTTPSVVISHTPTSKHVRELVQKAVKDRNIDDVQELLDNSMTLYCTDTGGQPEFQEVLPALIAGPVIFLFIFNLFTGLNSKYNVTFRTPSQTFEQFTSTFTVKQVLMQFLTSIASYHMFISRSLVQQTSIPPPSVVVIGTHRDLITDEAFRMIDEELWKVFEEASFESFKMNIIVPFNDNQLIIPINNYSKDNDSISVRRVIQSVVKDHYNIEVSVPWLALALHLRDLPDSAVTYTKCKEIARGYNISDNELPQCLMFLHHRTGTIRYYPDVKELKDTIIIKPSIIFHAVTQLITSTFALKNVRNIEKKKYAMYGLIEKSHVEQIFSGHKLEISYEAFLALLKYLYILGHSHDSKHGDYFFPCALVHVPESDDISTSVDPLLLVFGCGFVPKGFFSSLLAFLCQKKWEIERLSRYKPCIYRNEASFFVDEYQNVNVRLKATNNCLEISIKDDNPPPDVFCKILQILNQGILEICSRLKYDKEFSKPQFGFYCNYQTCRQGEKHFAVHNGMSMVKCDDTGKSYNMDSKRKLWFQDCSSDTPVVPPTPHYDDKTNKETHNPRNISFRDLLKKPPEMDDLVPLMRDISASWNEIGIDLKVPRDDRNSLLKNATLSDYGKMDTVIRKWNGTQKTDVTWETILNTLNEESDVRTKVIEFLEKPENYAKYINKADFVRTTYS